MLSEVPWLLVFQVILHNDWVVIDGPDLEVKDQVVVQLLWPGERVHSCYLFFNFNLASSSIFAALHDSHLGVLFQVNRGFVLFLESRNLFLTLDLIDVLHRLIKFTQALLGILARHLKLREFLPTQQRSIWGLLLVDPGPVHLLFVDGVLAHLGVVVVDDAQVIMAHVASCSVMVRALRELGFRERLQRLR